MLPLSSLRALDRDLLYVFVTGPGTGEGIALAMPRSGWVLVDGCQIDGASLLSALYDDFAETNEEVLAMILTHPHADHAAGFASLVDLRQPRQIAITGTTPLGPSLAQQAEAWVEGIVQSCTAEELSRRSVVSALKAIRAWERTHPSGLAIAVDGTAMAWPSTTARISIRAPEPRRHLTKVIGEISNGRLSRANEASVVAEVEYGLTKLVLGGDLPRIRGKNSSVPTGWNRVMGLHAHLGGATALKLPHHGSAGAFHRPLMKNAEGTWSVTPYNSSGLPSIAPDGLPRLIANNATIHLTRLPACLSRATGAIGTSIPLSALIARSQHQPTGDPFLDAGHDTRSPSRCGVRDPVWAFAFDDRGRLQGAWHGQEAVAIVR